MGHFWCVLAGIAAGMAGGLFGVGGGLIVVPFLVIAVKLSQHKAQGTSLLALTLPVAGVGAYNYYSKGYTDLAVGSFIALGILGGSRLGSALALRIEPTRMRKWFCALLVAIAGFLVFRDALVSGANGALVTGAWVSVAAVVIGLMGGVLGGFIGVGGGIVAVPAMVFVLGFSQHVAQGTSLFALSLPVAGLGAYNYFKKGNVDVPKGLEVAGGIIVGSFIGSSMALNIDPVNMRHGFAGFATVMATYLFFKR